MKRLVLTAIAVAFLVAPASAFALQQNPDGNADEKTETMTFKQGENLEGTTQGPGGTIHGDQERDVAPFKLTRTNFNQELLDSAGEI